GHLEDETMGDPGEQRQDPGESGVPEEDRGRGADEPLPLAPQTSPGPRIPARRGPAGRAPALRGDGPGAARGDASPRAGLLPTGLFPTGLFPAGLFPIPTGGVRAWLVRAGAIPGVVFAVLPEGSIHGRRSGAVRRGPVNGGRHV